VVASAPSRHNDPELAPVLHRWDKALSFDAENGPGIVTEVFGEVDVIALDETR
jgi:hypothetical protein